MKQVVALAMIAALMTGCSTMTPARYAASADNNQALRKFDGAKVQVAQLTAPANYSSNCRLVGPIQAADGKTIPEFVTQALNDELKFANLYAGDGLKLEGSLTKIEFSSMSGLTNGWWELGISLKSPNGKVLEKTSRTEFKSGFDALTACNQTAQALGGAVQDLIKVTVTDPSFGELLKP